jgi:hypothetical protein
MISDEPADDDEALRQVRFIRMRPGIRSMARTL